MSFLQVVKVPIGDQVTKPNSRRRIKGYGMPISKSPGTFGDLMVTIEVEFPQILSLDQKTALRQILS